mgnify:CR=1 FL=1
MKRIAIIDYGSGNLRSVANALQAVAAADEQIIVTALPGEVGTADRIILPGVGAFADCWRGLNALPDMLPVLERRVRREGIPFLGICVGMQLLAASGHEYGVSPGLNWLGGEVRGLQKPPGGKIPHMGWNELVLNQPLHPFFKGVASGAHVYFVHSYHLLPPSRDIVLAEAEYGQSIAAVAGRDNILGTQFHPEKSQQTGLRLLRNFLDWRLGEN